MQVLLFEMTPRDGHEDHYFSHVEKLRPIVMRHDGLLKIERFKSLQRPNVILSYQIWRDEAAISRWRIDQDHQKSQVAGRFQHFTDYRVRILHGLEYRAKNQPTSSWPDGGAYRTAGTGDRFVIVLHAADRRYEKLGETYQSVTEAASFLTLVAPEKPDEGQAILKAAMDAETAFLGRVTRDYGLFEREEAPQAFKAVALPD